LKIKDHKVVDVSGYSVGSKVYVGDDVKFDLDEETNISII